MNRETKIQSQTPTYAKEFGLALVTIFNPEAPGDCSREAFVTICSQRLKINNGRNYLVTHQEYNQERGSEASFRTGGIVVLTCADSHGEITVVYFISR